MKDAGPAGARTAPPDARAGIAVSVTGEAAYETQRHIVRHEFPAEGPLWGEAAKGIMCAERNERSARTICVVYSVGEARPGAQTRRNEHRSTWPFLHAIRRTERIPFSGVAVPFVRLHTIRAACESASVIPACLRRLQAVERNAATAASARASVFMVFEVGRGREAEWRATD